VEVLLPWLGTICNIVTPYENAPDDRVDTMSYLSKREAGKLAPEIMRSGEVDERINPVFS
jgi:hypothetical protein